MIPLYSGQLPATDR